jgi:hypothetical protein
MANQFGDEFHHLRIEGWDRETRLARRHFDEARAAGPREFS